MKPASHSQFSGTHELTDGNPALIALTGGALLLLLGAGVLGGAWWYRVHGDAGPTSRGKERAALFENGPRERTAIARDWEQQDAAARDHLERYAWIDRKAGRVRIPIRRAMERLAEGSDHTSGQGKETRR